MYGVDKIPDKDIIEAIGSSKTMREACSKLPMSFNAFKRRAINLDMYFPNPGGKGTHKPKAKKFATIDILDGKYPHYQTFKLKNRLIEEGYLKNECGICDISEWHGSWLPLELDHIDGNPTNHRIKNLRILCPNCHSQTDTFRARNKRKK